jgi:excisionase family DNA binding protein
VLDSHREKLMDNLMSVKEAAKYLGGISKWTVYAMLGKGKLKRTKVFGRTMVRESELLKVIQDDAPPRKLRLAANAEVTATEKDDAKA